MLTETEITEVLSSWQKQIPNLQLKEREVTSEIIRLHQQGKNKEVIDLVGARRTGKSSVLMLLIKQLKLQPEEYLYVNFEEPLFFNYCSLELMEKIWNLYRSKINPTKKPYLFFDEVQLVAGWEKWIRKIRDLELAHMFVTGSSSELLSREYGTALTGRHLSLKIYPLSFQEYLNFKGINLLQEEKSLNFKNRMLGLLEDYLNKGGFPEIALTDNPELLKNFLEDILYKDIILRHQIRDVNSLKKLALFCLTNFSNSMTYNSLRKQFSISLDTVREYFSYFEEAFLIFQMPIYSYSLKVQEVSPKKMYCIDNGLRNAVSFRLSKDLGRLAENLVFLELKRRKHEIYYWKSVKSKEVDFVISNKDSTLTAINVCYGDSIDSREIQSLSEFKKAFRKAKELIILTRDIEKKEGGINYTPLWKWLLQRNL